MYGVSATSGNALKIVWTYVARLPRGINMELSLKICIYHFSALVDKILVG